MKPIFTILLLAFCIAAPQAVQAQTKMEYVPLNTKKNLEYGIPKGHMIPHDLKGIDQNERDVSLSKLTGENGIVLFFMRSADWSQYCVFQLAELSQRGSIIEDTGYNIVVVSNDNIPKLARFGRKYSFPYPMISDTSSEIIKAFGLFDTNYQPGTTYYGIAHPAIYVIGKDGLILDKIFDRDFKVRPLVSEIRALLDKIGDYTPVATTEDATPISPESTEAPKDTNETTKANIPE